MNYGSVMRESTKEKFHALNRRRKEDRAYCQISWFVAGMAIACLGITMVYQIFRHG